MGRNMRGLRRRCYNSPLINFIVWFFVGVIMGAILYMELIETRDFPCPHSLKLVDISDNGVKSQMNRWIKNAINSNYESKFMFVGIMTAKKYLDSRCISVYDTWAKTIPGKVVFFSSEGSSLPQRPDIPIVSLPGVTDDYPPQKKSFLMLKYMHDKFLDKYSWFMRADDDVFVKGANLAQFLRSLNSSIPYFIGQSGQGTTEELGHLSLNANENFCMGGPGIIMSSRALRDVGPHISNCLKNLYSTHEDVEVGRCFRNFGNVQCTWAFEMASLFYQNYNDPQGSFFHNLNIPEIEKAITLHPFKDPKSLFRMQNHQFSLDIYQLKSKIIQLHREVSFMDSLLRTGYDNNLGLSLSINNLPPKNISHIISWQFFNEKSVFSQKHQGAKRAFDASLKASLKPELIDKVMRMINKNARQRGRTIDYREILYGYSRVNPLIGADYIVDLLLIYKKHKGHRMTVPVRRHAYLQRTFGEIVFKEENHNVFVDGLAHPQSKDSFVFKMMQNYFLDKNTASDVSYNSNQLPSIKINFILPLAGRFQTFLHFMHNFEEVCLKNNESVSLLVMLFNSELDDRSDDTIDYISTLKKLYPHHDMKVIHHNQRFSRAIGLQLGSDFFDENSLLFFIDVDIYIKRASLERIRANAIQGERVYYPIVFSQYDPKIMCDDSQSECPLRNSPFQFEEDYGYWRKFGYGIVAVYKSDMNYVGGFNTDIIGWGKEDIDFHEKFLKKNISIFRSIDLGMVHIFHSIACDSDVEENQYRMCLGSQMSTLGSLKMLSNFAYNTPEILEKNEFFEENDINNEKYEANR